MPWWQLLPYLLLTCLINSVSSNLIKKQIQRHALVNTSRTLQIVSDHFLSITFDPYMLPDLPWADSSIIKLARELHPAWINISPFASKIKSSDVDLSLYQWAALNHFASESGFKQMWDAKIFSQAAHKWKQNGLSVNNDVQGVPKIHNFPPPLAQIGFTVTNESISNVMNIKELLPSYNSDDLTIVGPDMKFFVNYDEVQEFSKWIKKNAEKVAAISWSPSALIGNKNETTKYLLTTEHGELFKLEHSVVHGMAEQMGFADKPLWIGDMRMLWENDSHVDFTGTFGSALLWLDRLGAAAVSGVDVAFQPDLLPMHVRGVRQQPSPEYWVAVLHKRLAGSRVLQVNSQCEGKADCRLYAHCTPGDDSTPYHAGSVTMIAINMKSSQLKGNVINLPKKTPMHLYILTGDVKSKKIFLNDDLLEIDPQTGDLPLIRPNIISSPREISLPPYSMAFWVFPKIVASACDNTHKRNKRLVPDTTHLALVFPADDKEQGEKENETQPKQKRCHNKKHVPVAPSILPKILLDTKILADECPPGCYHCNKGPCQIQKMNIVAPGCSTSQLLQRLIDLSQKRKAECCCGEEEAKAINIVSKDLYDNNGHTDYTKNRMQTENTIINDYSTKPTVAAGYTDNTPINKIYTNPGVKSGYFTTRNNNGYINKEYSTYNSNQNTEQIYSVPTQYPPSNKIENYREMPSHGINNNYGNTYGKYPDVKQNYPDDIRNMQFLNTREYNSPAEKSNYNSNNGGSSNYQYQNKLYSMPHSAGPTTPSMREFIDSKRNYDDNKNNMQYTPTKQNTPYATTSSQYIDSTSMINRDTYRSNGKDNGNGYHTPGDASYDNATPISQYQSPPKHSSDFKSSTAHGYTKIPNESEGYKIPVEVRYDTGAPDITYKVSPKYDLNSERTISNKTPITQVVGDGYAATEEMKYNTEPTTAPEYRVPSKSYVNVKKIAPDIHEKTSLKIKPTEQSRKYDTEKQNSEYKTSSTIPILETTSINSKIDTIFNKIPNNADSSSRSSEDINESESLSSEYTSTPRNGPKLEISGRHNVLSKPQIESPIHNMRIKGEVPPEYIGENPGEYAEDDSTSSDSSYQSNNKNDLNNSYLGKEHLQNKFESSNYNTHSINKDYQNEIQDRNVGNPNSYNDAENEVQGRLLDVNKNLLAPNLYPPYSHYAPYQPHLQYKPQEKPNLFDKLKNTIEMGKHKHKMDNPSNYFPHTGYDNNYYYGKSKLPFLGENLIHNKYPEHNLSPYNRPDLPYPPLRPDYYDPYHHQMYANDKLGPYHGNNLLGKHPSIYDAHQINNYKPPLLGSAPPNGIFGLRLEKDKEDSVYNTSPSPVNNYKTAAEYKESSSEPTYISHNPIKDVTYKEQENNYVEHTNTDDKHQGPYNPKYTKHQYPAHTSPVLAEECVLRCAGNKICDQSSFYKFVETIFSQLLDKRSHETENKDCYGLHSCGELKKERDLNGNDKLIDSLQNILSKGTDPRRIKLGSVYVECPSECQPNSCVDSFSRKIKIILSIISWLKDCIAQK